MAPFRSYSSSYLLALGAGLLCGGLGVLYRFQSTAGCLFNTPTAHHTHSVSIGCYVLHVLLGKSGC